MRPQQRAGERADVDRPARERVSGGDAHDQLRAFARAARMTATCAACSIGPNHRMRRDSHDRDEGEHRIGERVLAEQHAVARVHQQADAPGHPQADEARLADAPEARTARRSRAPAAGPSRAGN